MRTLTTLTYSSCVGGRFTCVRSHERTKNIRIVCASPREATSPHFFISRVKGNKANHQLIAIDLARRYCQINLEVNPFPMSLFTTIVAILAFWLCLAVVRALPAEISLVLLQKSCGVSCLPLLLSIRWNDGVVVHPWPPQTLIRLVDERIWCPIIRRLSILEEFVRPRPACAVIGTVHLRCHPSLLNTISRADHPTLMNV